MTWYGWDGDRLTTIQNDRSLHPDDLSAGSFTPLISVATATGEQAKTQRRSLDTLQQSGGEDGGSAAFPPVLVQMLDRLEVKSWLTG